MTTRRRATLALLALVAAATMAVGGNVVDVPADAAAAGNVHWDPDYSGHKITVTVDLTFFGNCGGNDICAEATRLAAGNIVNSILADWNGHRYKCWPFIVKINDRVVDTVDQTPAGSMPILLSWTPVASARAFTSVVGGSENFQSLSPQDAPQPANNPKDPSQWPAADDTSVYTHEFGHVLGLDENYDPGAPKDSQGRLIPILRPGQTDDAMFAADPSTTHLVSEDMINRVVERSGKVDTSKVVCPMTLNSGPSSINLILLELHDLAVHLYTCDYDLPSSDPKRPVKPMHFKGTWAGAGSFLGSGGSAQYPVELDATIPQQGGVLSFTVTGNGHTLTMSARFHWDQNGLLQQSEPWNIDGATTAIFSPPYVSTTTDSAPECPSS